MGICHSSSKKTSNQDRLERFKEHMKRLDEIKKMEMQAEQQQHQKRHKSLQINQNEKLQIQETIQKKRLSLQQKNSDISINNHTQKQNKDCQILETKKKLTEKLNVLRNDKQQEYSDELYQAYDSYLNDMKRNMDIENLKRRINKEKEIEYL